MTDYTVGLSNVSSDDGYDVLREFDSAGVEQIVLPPSANAHGRYLIIDFPDFTSLTAGCFDLGGAHNEIVEIEVWNVETVTVGDDPVDETPRCAAG